MKTTVAFVIPTLGGGGAEKVLVNLLNNINTDKFDVTLISLFDGGENLRSLSNKIKYKYYFKKTFRGNVLLLKLFNPEYLYRKIIKKQYDIVVSYLEGSCTRIVSGCPYSKTKLVSWVHIEIPKATNLLRSYRSIKEINSTYNKFDNIAFVSDTAKQTFENTFNDITASKSVIYNTVESKKILNKSKEAVENISFDRSKINMISVGRFVNQKGYERLIETIKKLNSINNIHLYLMGQGPLEGEYIKLIKKYKLENVITIIGYDENPYKYVANCDLFVCSSFKEGFSTAVTESLIVGTPVITTECSGMKELLGENNEYGVIVDNTSEALYDGLKNLIYDKELLEHYQKQAQLRSKIFSTETTVRDVENFLDSLIK